VPRTYEFRAPITRGFYFRTGETIHELFPNIGLFIGRKGDSAEITLAANVVDFVGVRHTTTDDSTRMSAVFFRAIITIRIFYNEILVDEIREIRIVSIHTYIHTNNRYNK
jgi:hypothetical protein